MHLKKLNKVGTHTLNNLLQYSSLWYIQGNRLVLMIAWLPVIVCKSLEPFFFQKD